MMISDGAPVPLVDDPFAEEIFATSTSGVFQVLGNLVITLESLSSDYSVQPPTLYRKVAGRLVMPVQAAQALVIELNNYLEQHGAGPSAAARHGETSQ